MYMLLCAYVYIEPHNNDDKLYEWPTEEGMARRDAALRLAGSAVSAYKQGV